MTDDESTSAAVCHLQFPGVPVAEHFISSVISEHAELKQVPGGFHLHDLVAASALHCP